MAEIKKILCAVDFSEHSPRVADFAATLARSFGAEVLCLYVAPSPQRIPGLPCAPQLHREFRGRDRGRRGLHHGGVRGQTLSGVVFTGKVLTGYAAEEILAAITNEKADLLVMGTHGRKGIDRILFGSVAEKVVKSATCPVLTVRPLAAAK